MSMMDMFGCQDELPHDDIAPSYASSGGGGAGGAMAAADDVQHPFLYAEEEMPALQ